MPVDVFLLPARLLVTPLGAEAAVEVVAEEEAVEVLLPT